MGVVLDAERIAPVDVAVVGFDGTEFNGEVIPALLQLVDDGLVRIIDMAFVRKDAAGEVTFIEVADLDNPTLAGLDDPENDLLNDQDLLSVGQDLAPKGSAIVIVWENLWLARAAAAIAGSGGFLISHDRIPHDVVVNAINALQED